MIKDLLTSRDLEYNDILLYSKHISALTILNSSEIIDSKFRYQCDDVSEFKKCLINMIS